MLSGVVTGVAARSVDVHVDDVGPVRCTLRSQLWDLDKKQSRPCAVGDRVQVELKTRPESPATASRARSIIPDESVHGVICAIEPRRNELARLRGGRKRGPRQVIAANLDGLVIVAAFTDPPFRAGLVDRFVVSARVRGIHPVLIINKIDLADGLAHDLTDDEASPEALAQPYIDAEVEVILTSATRGDGIETLNTCLNTGIHLLLGHSGVGKSSLLNSVDPDLKLAIGAVAEHHGRGKHTTTRVTLLPFGDKGWVIDSPGLREFGLLDIEPSDAARLFPGLNDLPDACKFRDCLHNKEPGCAVLAAVESGEFPAERHEGYLRMLEELDQPVQW